MAWLGCGSSVGVCSKLFVVLPRRLPPPVPAVFLGGPGLHWVERAPDPRLAPWIATVWSLRCDVPQPLRVLPDGCMDIIGSDLVGSLTRPLVANLSSGDASVGIRLRPGAFTALTGIPASELRDQRLPLSEVMSPRPLLTLAAEAPPPDPLAALALRAPSVKWLARETGYSERQLRRRLVAATGHGPTRLRRIGRMQALLSAGRGASWARSAAEFGYHDESHMINDIRALAGATPQALMRGRFLQVP
jgi:AraC-like DNA-binding protein